jgi:hypothetical protein
MLLLQHGRSSYDEQAACRTIVTTIASRCILGTEKRRPQGPAHERRKRTPQRDAGAFVGLPDDSGISDRADLCHLFVGQGTIERVGNRWRG